MTSIAARQVGVRGFLLSVLTATALTLGAAIPRRPWRQHAPS